MMSCQFLEVQLDQAAFFDNALENVHCVDVFVADGAVVVDVSADSCQLDPACFPLTPVMSLRIKFHFSTQGISSRRPRC